MGLKAYEASHDSGKRFPGQLLLKPKSKLKHFNISYGSGKAILRPWGDVMVDENGIATMAPWRDKQGNFGTSWFVQDDICQGWAKEFQFTAFTRCEDEQNWPTGSPLQLLFDEVKYSEKWKDLLVKPGKGFALISPPKHVGILKGLLIEANGKDYRERPFWGVMAVFAPSAREALDDLLNVKADATTPAGTFTDDPYGWNSQYVVGDPIGLQCGKVFEFDKESKIRGGGETQEINVMADARTSSRGSSGSSVEKYGCRIYPTRPTLALPIDKVRKYDESFVDALWFMTGEEQINNLIIRGFGHSHPELVKYTFGGKGVLPKSYEFGTVTVDMAPAPAPKPTAKPTAPPPPTESEAPGDDDINLGGENPPWEDNDDAGAATAAAPVESPATAAATSTADSIKARLAAASKKA